MGAGHWSQQRGTSRQSSDHVWRRTDLRASAPLKCVRPCGNEPSIRARASRVSGGCGRLGGYGAPVARWQGKHGWPGQPPGQLRGPTRQRRCVPGPSLGTSTGRKCARCPADGRRRATRRRPAGGSIPAAMARHARMNRVRRRARGTTHPSGRPPRTGYPGTLKRHRVPVSTRCQRRAGSSREGRWGRKRPQRPRRPTAGFGMQGEVTHPQQREAREPLTRLPLYAFQ